MSEEQQATSPVENESAQPVADVANLQSQLEALKAKNSELINERRKDKENREKLQEQLNDKYGDSLIIYYSSNGHFRRIHLNSAKYGADSQFYFPKESKLYFTYKVYSSLYVCL